MYFPMARHRTSGPHHGCFFASFSACQRMSRLQTLTPSTAFGRYRSALPALLLPSCFHCSLHWDVDFEVHKCTSEVGNYEINSGRKKQGWDSPWFCDVNYRVQRCGYIVGSTPGSDLMVQMVSVMVVLYFITLCLYTWDTSVHVHTQSVIQLSW